MSTDTLFSRIEGADNALVLSDDTGNIYRIEPSGDTFRLTKNASVHGGWKQPVAAKTADYTCTVEDCGKVFTNRGAAAAVDFTLPAASGNAGLWYDFIAVADFAIAVKGADEGMITFNNATADAVSIETTAEIIGGGVRAVCDGTSWLIFFNINEAVTPVILDVSAALTGTFLTTPTEAEVVTGGQTIIITLGGNGKWVVAAGSVFDGQRQNIINGLDSGGAEAGGWDAKVKAVMAVTTVVRTSDTVVTITLPATGDYSITANETVTVTVPATAIQHGIAAVAGDVTITIVAA